MGWPQEAYLYLRQIVKPKSLPQQGGNFLYTKSDNGLYLLDADGTEHLVGGDGSSAAFFKKDSTAVTADGGPTDLVLSYLPLNDSLHFYWNGVEQKEGVDWTRSGLVVTFSETHQKTGDYLEARYAYNPVDLGVALPVITSPTNGATMADTTPTFVGTAASGRTVSVRVDGVSIGTTVPDAAGDWSFTPSSGISSGAHSVVARQTNPDTSTDDSASVSFTITASFTTLMTGLGPSLWWRLGDAAGTTALDSSGNSHTGTAASVTFGATGMVTGDTAATFTAPARIDASAYGAWMNSASISGVSLLKTTNTDANGIVIMSRWDGAASLWIFDHVNGNLRLKLNGTTVTTSGLTLNDGNKHMAGFSYDGTTVKIYADGSLVKSQAASATYTGGANFTVGADRSGGGGSLLHHFSGTLDEPAYWAGTILTASNFSDLWSLAV